jgi:regulator of protease activity HflC (stomatin/prohibitin superfamily)
VGRLELDRTFEERTSINNKIVTELDVATEPWGVKVLRYEIKNITPPRDVLDAMEKQMRAEREKRAQILASEGARDAAINVAEGEKQRLIKGSEAQKIMQINEAEGQAEAIRAVAEATASGIQQVAAAVSVPGGSEAMQMRVAEQYIIQFGELAKKSTTMILPANLTEVGSMVAAATEVFKKRSPAAIGEGKTSEN